MLKISINNLFASSNLPSETYVFARLFFGPISFGSLQPSMIQDLLRGLSPGEFTPPTQLGEWHILIRLEQISPSSFDSKTRDKLLNDQLSAFIKDRSMTLFNGEPLEPLYYDPE